MRPRSAPLPRATCRNLRFPPRSPCATRSFTAAAQTHPLHYKTRPHPPAQLFSQVSQQKRFITRQWIQRIKDGEKEWARHAEEIKEGKRLSFAAHLEERGLIHDVVGYGCSTDVSSGAMILDLGFGADRLQRTRIATQGVYGEESWHIRWNRPYGAINARWTHASIYGIGLGIRLGIACDVSGRFGAIDRIHLDL